MRYARTTYTLLLIARLQVVWGRSTPCTESDHLSVYIADLFATPFDPRNQVEANETHCIMANACTGRPLDDDMTTFETDYNRLVRTVVRKPPRPTPHRINGT